MKNVVILTIVSAIVLAFGGCTTADPWAKCPDVVFTFDDGFAEHYELVAPILEKYGFRGSFNVITDRIGTEGYMTWEQLRDLDRRGHAIENHTLSHPDLAALAKAGETNELTRQVLLSRDRIATRIGRAPTFVCYPCGKASPETHLAIRDTFQIPMSCARRNFGEGTKPGDVTAYIRERVAAGYRVVDLLTHGVTAGGHAWRPFPSPAAFEAYVQEVWRLVDQREVRVRLYRDCPVW